MVDVLGDAPTRDISPTSGTVFFVSNEARQYISLTVHADDDPEGMEVYSENIVLFYSIKLFYHSFYYKGKGICL